MYEAPEESQAMEKLSRSGDMSTLDTLLVFFVWRQDHEEALEGDGEVFEGRRKPTWLRFPLDADEVYWHWGNYCQCHASRS